MANLCSYLMKVVGKPSDIRAFIDVLQNHDYHNGKRHLYRVSSDEVQDTSTIDKGYALIGGTCAHSIKSTMISGRYSYYTLDKKRESGDSNGTTIQKESESLNLKIEVYSEEDGFGFEEHFIIDKGAIIVDDTQDMSQYLTSDYQDVNELNKVANTSHSKEAFESNDFLKSGGHDEWVFSI